MGANQSQEDALPEDKSSVENYPFPLGRFKSSMIIDDIRQKIAKRHQISVHRGKYFQKSNISFAHGISLPSDVPELEVVAFCKSNDPNSKEWYIQGILKLTLHNWKDSKNSKSLERQNACFRSEFGTAPVTMNTHVLFERLLDEENGFVKDNKIWIETDFRIQKISKFYQPLVIDYRFSPENQNEKFTLLFEDGDKLYGNKAIMDAHYSHAKHLTQLSDMNEIQINNFSSGTIGEFMDSLHGFPISFFGRGRLQDFCSLSTYFHMRSVSQRAQQQVINELRIYEIPDNHLKIAIKYDLRRVVHAWTYRKKSINKKEVENLGIEKMSGEIMKTIVKRVFELGWETEN